MVSIGTIDGYTFKFQEENYEVYKKYLEKLYNYKSDLVKPDNSILRKGYEIFRNLLMEEISKVNPLLIPNIESNIQYEKLKLLTEDKYVFYDRLNTTTSLYFTDVLTQIFKEAYFEGKAFYNYFIPSSIYDNISKPSRDLIETKEIDDRLFDEETISLLLSWDLVNINKGQIRVTEKFKSFL